MKLSIWRLGINNLFKFGFILMVIIRGSNYGLAADDKYFEIYWQYEKQMIAASNGAWDYKNALPTIERCYNEGEPEAYNLWGDMLITIEAKPLKFQGATNIILSRFLETQKKDDYLVPKLTVTQALEKGKKYLAEFNISTTTGLTLKSIDFNGQEPNCWKVIWTRVVDSRYAWDNFDPTLQEGVTVIFHEEYGLVALGNNIYTPPPKKLEVKTTQEQAIQKATQCAPLVFKTPFYRQARADGFVISGLKSCELKVSIPNWLLDPQRAWWPRTHPPTETRLCWVVRFTTVDSKATERKAKDGPLLRLIPPDIVIYLDAETGECVGASCT